MYKGKFRVGIEFYNMLIESKEFNSKVGNVLLALGKLQAELITFFTRKLISGNNKRAILTTLIEFAKRNRLFYMSTIISIKQVTLQHNFITHNIYTLFINLINESNLTKRYS